MNKASMIKIIIFLILSSLCLFLSAFLFGSLYLPGRTNPSSAESTSPLYTTVIIDAGHGGEDGGTSSKSGLVEKDVNLGIARMLSDMLSTNGVNVVMTRDEDKLLYDRNVNYQGRKKKLDMAARQTVMSNTEDAIFISIHMNSFADSRYSGLQVWYAEKIPNSQNLARMIQQTNKSMLQPENERKIKNAGSSIYLLDKATCPAVLVECGFLSNIGEAAKFETEEYRRAVAFMLFRSVTDFIENSTETVNP